MQLCQPEMTNGFAHAQFDDFGNSLDERRRQTSKAMFDDDDAGRNNSGDHDRNVSVMDDDDEEEECDGGPGTPKRRRSSSVFDKSVDTDEGFRCRQTGDGGDDGRSRREDGYGDEQDGKNTDEDGKGNDDDGRADDEQERSSRRRRRRSTDESISRHPDGSTSPEGRNHAGGRTSPESVDVVVGGRIGAMPRRRADDFRLQKWMRTSSLLAESRRYGGLHAQMTAAAAVAAAAASTRCRSMLSYPSSILPYSSNGWTPHHRLRLPDRLDGRGVCSQSAVNAASGAAEAAAAAARGLGILSSFSSNGSSEAPGSVDPIGSSATVAAAAAAALWCGNSALLLNSQYAFHTWLQSSYIGQQQQNHHQQQQDQQQQQQQQQQQRIDQHHPSSSLSSSTLPSSPEGSPPNPPSTSDRSQPVSSMPPRCRKANENGDVVGDVRFSRFAPYQIARRLSDLVAPPPSSSSPSSNALSPPTSGAMSSSSSPSSTVAENAWKSLNSVAKSDGKGLSNLSHMEEMVNGLCKKQLQTATLSIVQGDRCNWYLV